MPVAKLKKKSLPKPAKKPEREVIPFDETISSEQPGVKDGSELNALIRVYEKISFTGEQEKSQMEFYRKNPAKWVYDRLGYELKYIQPKIIQAVADGEDVAVRTGHKCGKSFISACTLIWWLETHEPGKVLTTAPGQRQLKHILWAEVGRLYRKWKGRHPWELSASMWLFHKANPEEWFALGVYANDPGNIEGFHAKHLLCIVDEAKQVPDAFFDAVNSMQGQRMLVSVPPLNAEGYFVNVVTKQKGSWKHFHASSERSPFVKPAWLKKMEVEWVKGSIVWQAKIEGNIPTASSEDLVVNPYDVEQAQLRWELPMDHPDKVDYSEVEPTAGLDVARFGDDLSVLTFMQGFRLMKAKGWSKQSTMVTVGKVKEELERYCDAPHRRQYEWDPKKVKLAVDDTGLGGGVTDKLQEDGYNVVPINFGSKARDPEQYNNKRSEMWFYLTSPTEKEPDKRVIDLLELPPDEWMDGIGGRIAAELCWPKIKYTSLGRALEPKESIKKRLGRSPDFGDAFVLALEAGRAEPYGIEIW